MSAPANWYDSLPTPTSKSDTITAEELHAKLIAGGKGVLVVDTRRQDLDVALIPGAINLPAHSFYQTLPTLYPILSQFSEVIFHCQSSSGRGPRCAAWYQDKLVLEGNDKSKSLVLAGGIKNWVKAYGGTDMVIPLVE